MARVNTYLNFTRETEQAFTFYRSVFGGEFTVLQRFGEVPAASGQPVLAHADRELIMHVALPILGGHVLMGTDAPETMGFRIVRGNNVYISLEIDLRADADRLFGALSAGGEVETPMQEMFWGAWFGSFTDRFGIRWMINCPGG